MRSSPSGAACGGKVAQRSVFQPYILILQVLTLGTLSLVSGRSVFNGDLIAYALPGVAGAWLVCRCSRS